MKAIIIDKIIDRSKANLKLRIKRNIEEKEKKGEENDKNEKIKTNKKRSMPYFVYKE